MSLTVLFAAGALFAQEVPAPPMVEVDVVALERCVSANDDVSKCGDFDDDVADLQTCHEGIDTAKGVDAFLDAWSECEATVDCLWWKPQPGQTELVIRYCAARNVAARKIISARWMGRIETQLNAQQRDELDQVKKRIQDQLVLDTAEEDPLRASAHWSGAWGSWFNALGFAVAVGRS